MNEKGATALLTFESAGAARAAVTCSALGVYSVATALALALASLFFGADRLFQACVLTSLGPWLHLAGSRVKVR